MPRYLGLNYLHEASTARRQFLNKSLLTVPQHLEYVEKYCHSGFVPDGLYMVPWTKVKADEAFLEGEGQLASCDLKVLTEGLCKSNVETFSKQIPEVTPGDGWEVIPSSNPESQEALAGMLTTHIVDDCDDNDLQNSSDNGEPHKETFAPYALSCCITGCKDLLEEVITKEPFQEYLLKLPRVRNLLSCLQQYTVKDPLLEYDSVGEPKGLLRNDRQLEDGSGRQDEVEIELKSPQETFTKVPFETSEYLLEETICTTELQPLNYGGSLSDFLASCHPEIIKNDSEIGDVLQKLVESTPGIHLMSGTEHGKFSPCHAQSASFIDINGGSEFKESVSVDEMLLEVPLMLSFGASETKPSLTEEALGELTVMKLEQDEEVCCFLTPKHSERLYELYWKEEKFFNETLELRLTEPIIPEPEIHTASLTSELVDLLSLTALTHSIDEELSLPWDLLGLFKNSVVKQPVLENIVLNWTSGDLDQQNGVLPNLVWVEKLEKYPAALLYDCSDPVLELVKPTSDFVRLRNAILGRQKRDKLSALPRKVKSVYSRILPQTAVSYPPKTSKKPVIVKPYKKTPVKDDSLNDFLWIIRSTVSSSSTEGNDSSDSRKVQCAEKAVSSKAPVTEDKEKVLSVTMSGEYSEAAMLLSEYIQEALHHLFDQRILPPHQHLATLTPDMTRFLVKQMEKQDKDQDCYKDLLLVHVVTCVYDMYLHCSLETGIFCLSGLEERYQQALGGSIVELKQKLFQLQHKLKTNLCLHPKMKEMCVYIEEWLGKQNSKLESKVLVIVKRDVERLLSELHQTLASCSQLRPVIITSTEQDPAAPLNKFDQVECVITPARAIQKTFPWSLFNLVVEYEHHPQAGWQTICHQRSIWYLALKLDPTRVCVGAGLVRQNRRPQLAVIGSQKLTAHAELLQLLENRFNILIVERDYSSLHTGRSYLHFADITVDVKSGICLHSLTDLISPAQLQEMCDKLFSFHQKYTHFCLILCPQFSSCKSLPPAKSTNVDRLQNALSQFANTVDDFVIKIVVCKDTEEVARVISTIGEEVVHSQTSENMKNIVEEKEMTPEEKYLLAFPCFNSMSAKLMLSKTTLEQLMLMNAADLRLMFPSLPVKVIQRFVQLRACMNDPLVHPTEDTDVTESRPQGRSVVASYSDVEKAAITSDCWRDPEVMHILAGQDNRFIDKRSCQAPDRQMVQSFEPDLPQPRPVAQEPQPRPVAPGPHQPRAVALDPHQLRTVAPDPQPRPVAPGPHQPWAVAPGPHQPRTVGPFQYRSGTRQQQPHEIEEHPELHLEQGSSLPLQGLHLNDRMDQHPKQPDSHLHASLDTSVREWNYCDENESYGDDQIPQSPLQPKKFHKAAFPGDAKRWTGDRSDSYNNDCGTEKLDCEEFDLSQPNEFTKAEMEGQLLMGASGNGKMRVINKTTDTLPQTPLELVSGLTLTVNSSSNQLDRFKPRDPWGESKGASTSSRTRSNAYGTTEKFFIQGQKQSEVLRVASLSPPTCTSSKMYQKKTSTHDNFSEAWPDDLYQTPSCSARAKNYVSEFLDSLKHSTSNLDPEQKLDITLSSIRRATPDDATVGHNKNSAPLYSSRHLENMKCTVFRHATEPNLKGCQHAMDRNFSWETDLSNPDTMFASEVSGYYQKCNHTGRSPAHKNRVSNKSGFSPNSTQYFQQNCGYKRQMNSLSKTVASSGGSLPVRHGYSSMPAMGSRPVLTTENTNSQPVRPGHNMHLQASCSHPHFQRISNGLSQLLPKNHPPQEPSATDGLMVQEGDSPPMDLDLDEDSLNKIKPGDHDYMAWDKPNSAQLLYGNKIFAPQPRTTSPNDSFARTAADESGMLSLIPSKRKRLGLERMPGAKDGQTRLSFS